MKSYYLVVVQFFLCITLCSCDNDSETQLELVFLIFRHGERVPETNEQFPNDNHPINFYYPLTYGEITKEGKRRQFHLGKKFRKRYDDFFGSLYTTSTVAAYTTDWDRTKMSLLLMLAGLFPPHPSQIWNEELKWLPIPFSYETSQNDHILQRPDPYCPRYVRELEKILKSEEIQDMTKKYKKIFDYVSQQSGRNIYDYHEMLRIYQNINFKRYVNLTNPDWTKNVYPEPMQTIASYQCVFENYTPLLRRLNGGHILQKFIEISRQKMNNQLKPDGRKLYLYSGHENNIVNILAVLGLYHQHIPPYCSAVAIELHKSRITNKYGFKVFYDNDTYSDDINEMIIPGCSKFCNFDTFVHLTKDVVPVNYTAECESDVFLD